MLETCLIYKNILKRQIGNSLTGNLSIESNNNFFCSNNYKFLVTSLLRQTNDIYLQNVQGEYICLKYFDNKCWDMKILIVFIKERKKEKGKLKVRYNN